MKKLSDRDKRTLRIASVLIAGYLAVFYGSQGWRSLKDWEGRYAQRKLESEQLTVRLLKEKKKQKRVRELREAIAIELEKLDDETLVSEARVAIQATAKTHGVALGPSKETPAGSEAKELATIHLEGQGTVLGVSKFIHSLPLLGYPLSIQRIAMTPDQKKPGNMSFRMSAVILSVKAWKPGEKKSA